MIFFAPQNWEDGTLFSADAADLGGFFLLLRKKNHLIYYPCLSTASAENRVPYFRRSRGSTTSFLMSLIFKKATTADIPLLTKTAFESKGFWGYPAEWMELWRSDLTMTEESISQNTVVKAFYEKQFVGFYVLINLGAGKWDLDGFWILPGEMGKGYGKQLFAHLMVFLRQQNAEKLEVVSDPNANGFYEKMGGEKVGKFASKPEGRELDVFHINLGGF